MTSVVSSTVDLQAQIVLTIVNIVEKSVGVQEIIYLEHLSDRARAYSAGLLTDEGAAKPIAVLGR